MKENVLQISNSNAKFCTRAPELSYPPFYPGRDDVYSSIEKTTPSESPYEMHCFFDTLSWPFHESRNKHGFLKNPPQSEAPIIVPSSKSLFGIQGLLDLVEFLVFSEDVRQQRAHQRYIFRGEMSSSIIQDSKTNLYSLERRRWKRLSYMYLSVFRVFVFVSPSPPLSLFWEMWLGMFVCLCLCLPDCRCLSISVSMAFRKDLTVFCFTTFMFASVCQWVCLWVWVSLTVCSCVCFCLSYYIGVCFGG